MKVKIVKPIFVLSEYPRVNYLNQIFDVIVRYKGYVDFGFPDNGPRIELRNFSIFKKGAPLLTTKDFRRYLKEDYIEVIYENQ